MGFLERLLQWGRGCSAAEGKGLVLATTCSARFNGAAAVQPRKARRHSEKPAEAYGFNGAAAVQPRKAAKTWSRPSPPATLQWGRGCSAAEGRPQMLMAVTHEWLQWGRGCSAAEGRCVALHRHQPFDASMGPRLFSRGRDAGTDCGRRRGRGFNGAAAVQPRKARRASVLASNRCPLQWGRGCSAAEGWEKPYICLVGGRASMGPRLFSRGRPGGAGRRGGRPARFNGAAAVQPRKVGPRALAMIRVGAASMGPRLFSRGRPVVTHYSYHASILLQWGRGCSAAEGNHCLPLPGVLSFASMGPRLFSRGRCLRSLSSSPAW